MSSRQLRKLQQHRQREKAQDLEAKEREESDNVESPAIAPSSRPNLFDALSGGYEDAEEDEVEDNSCAISDTTHITMGPNFNKSRRKKHQKRKKQKESKASQDRQEGANGEGQDGDSEDEIDRALKELKIQPQDQGYKTAHDTRNETASRMSELLCINPNHLRVANEMRNLFGREAIGSANVTEQQENNRRGHGPIQRDVDLETFLREPPGSPKLPELSLRRNFFVQGRDHWPRQTTGGLSMKEIDQAPDGTWAEYAFLHGRRYDSVQMSFFLMANAGDPIGMVHLLKHHPYHVSTLLQVSSVAKLDQNMALAAELCERALFTFGRVTTSSFRQNVEQGRARLNFCRPENRQFWLAGYHYMKSLLRKGTYRTALEWAKLLYALDHKDPYDMRHFIPTLAVKAHQSAWLVEFLAEMERAGEGGGDIIYVRQTAILAKLQINDVEGARMCLEKGVQRLPWLYCTLFQELNLDAPPSVWGISPDGDARSFWVRLYIHQNKDLWNNAQATMLLQEVAKKLGRVDVKALPMSDDPVDLGATRLAYLEGQTSLLGVAPRDLLEMQPNYECDPLPPPEEENVFATSASQLMWNYQRAIDQLDSQDQLLPQNLNAHQARLALAGAFTEDDDEDDDVEEGEMREAGQAEEEEIDRVLEARWGGNEQGLLAALRRMLQRRGGTDASAAESTDASTERLPGAWPAEEGGNDVERRSG